MQSYAIGRLILHPHRELLDGGVPVAIGGRALDLLSVLAEAEGGMVTKDELLAKVWGRTIVDDNAVQAQVSIARKALGSEAGRLVTVHRHGYRLDLDGDLEPPSSPQLAAPAIDPRTAPAENVPAPIAIPDESSRATARAQRQWTRRAAAGAALVVGAGAATGLALWPRSNRHEPEPRAVALYQRAHRLSQRFDPEADGVARSLLEQAVTIDPKFADAWGALALARRGPTIPEFAGLGDPGLVRAAARHALALDPDQADARLALILLYPPYRRWLLQEARLRTFLTSHPRSQFGHAVLAMLLLEVGRYEDAVALARRANYLDPESPLGWWVLGGALDLAGRFEEADIALTAGIQRFPDNVWLWSRRYWMLFDGKRYDEAAAFVRDRSRRPRRVPGQLAEEMARIADDLTTPQGIARRREIQRNPTPQTPRSVLDWIVVTAPMFARLGMTDEVFDALAAYYFGGTLNGTRIAAPGPLDSRITGVLFNPCLLALRDDPRWGALLERTGLEDYWRKSGTQPDFRRS